MAVIAAITLTTFTEAQNLQSAKNASQMHKNLLAGGLRVTAEVQADNTQRHANRQQTESHYRAALGVVDAVYHVADVVHHRGDPGKLNSTLVVA